mmetsp:Transcript_70698/g.197560  ORF Transcript_70698/g.197560 Transcript_70698/m.197560 type:complete len:133 (+) Transcript_70698:1233-1631(+)
MAIFVIIRPPMASAHAAAATLPTPPRANATEVVVAAVVFGGKLVRASRWSHSPEHVTRGTKQKACGTKLGGGWAHTSSSRTLSPWWRKSCARLPTNKLVEQTANAAQYTGLYLRTRPSGRDNNGEHGKCVTR